jgi:5-formyltetrahydrofolate cyclo-ligase
MFLIHAPGTPVLFLAKIFYPVMMIAKTELRKTMKARLAALPPERFAAEGAAAAERLAGAALWQRHGCILLYAAMAGEIATAPLLERAFAAGKAVFFPKVEGVELRFFRIGPSDSGGADWAAGAFGIREPRDASPERLFRPEAGPALVVTPGLAFDRRGNRMGRGRGYYDRFFAGLDRAGARYEAAGFCLSCQLVETVPVESFDKRLDALCTGEELLVFG